MRIRWLTKAAEDLERIYVYLQDKHPELADSTMDEIYGAILSLREVPYRGRPSRRPDVRELVLHRLPYIVFYRLNDQVIEVLYIRHGAQDRPSTQ